jgi:molecular chaperone GrpE
MSDTKKKQTELEQRVIELENNWKRALADYRNLQKRTAEEKETTMRFANQFLIAKLLFIVDSLELMVIHFENEGLSLILKEFKQILSDEGLEEIDVAGKNFDENLMDALETVNVDSAELQDKVVEIVQKGYTLRGKILRPAKVKVGKFNAEQTHDSAN